MHKRTGQVQAGELTHEAAHVEVRDELYLVAVAVCFALLRGILLVEGVRGVNSDRHGKATLAGVAVGSRTCVIPLHAGAKLQIVRSRSTCCAPFERSN